MARIGVQRWSLNCRMCACVTLCHSLCTVARSLVVFLGNGFISLMRVDIYDHMLSIILISGPSVGLRRSSIVALARNPSLMLEDYSICQCMMINVWLIMRPGDVISIFLCS